MTPLLFVCLLGEKRLICPSECHLNMYQEILIKRLFANAPSDLIRVFQVHGVSCTCRYTGKSQSYLLNLSLTFILRFQKCASINTVNLVALIHS